VASAFLPFRGFGVSSAAFDGTSPTAWSAATIPATTAAEMTWACSASSAFLASFFFSSKDETALWRLMLGLMTSWSPKNSAISSRLSNLWMFAFACSALSETSTGRTFPFSSCGMSRWPFFGPSSITGRCIQSPRT
jgi:hypothetical protein